jgi:hypothetical protein
MNFKKLTPFGAVIIRKMVDKRLNREDMAARIRMKPESLTTVLYGRRGVCPRLLRLYVCRCCASVEEAETAQTAAVKSNVEGGFYKNVNAVNDLDIERVWREGK